MKILGITLHKQVPTVINSHHLYCWAKFCTGECVDGTYRFGAVKAPSVEQKWFPAAISKKNIIIATTKAFTTPEKAIEWLQAAG